VAPDDDGRGAVTDRDLNVHANRRSVRLRKGAAMTGSPYITGVSAQGAGGRHCACRIIAALATADNRPATTTSFHFVSLADARCRFARSCPK
jgi:hypothetical protein